LKGHGFSRATIGQLECFFASLCAIRASSSRDGRSRVHRSANAAAGLSDTIWLSNFKARGKKNGIAVYGDGIAMQGGFSQLEKGLRKVLTLL
jgi:hypothetical protein